MRLFFYWIIVCFSATFLEASTLKELIKIVEKDSQLIEMQFNRRLKQEKTMKIVNQPINTRYTSLLNYAVETKNFELAEFLILHHGQYTFAPADIEPLQQLYRYINLANSAIRPRDFPKIAGFIFKNVYASIKDIPVAAAPCIPKIIHQIWIGPNPVPERVVWMMESWKKNHPDWEYRLWTNQDLESFDLENQEAFNNSPNWGAKSDILRCEILFRYGGVYVDIDFESIRPLDPLIYKFDFFSSLIEDGCVANGVIGAAIHHPILRKCIDRWLEKQSYVGKDFNHVLNNTGPVFFSRILAEYFSDMPIAAERSVVLPTDYFFAFPRFQRANFWKGLLPRSEVLKHLTANSFAIHYWATTWQEE